MNDNMEKIPVTVRLNPETLERLDVMRGKNSRQHMIVGAIHVLLKGDIEVPPVKIPEPIGVLVNRTQEAA
jgi:hypothetical protein